MPIGIVTIEIKDGNGTTRTARFVSSDASVAGLLMPAQTLVDQAEAEVLGRVTAAPTRYSALDRLRKSGRLFDAAMTQMTRPSNTTAYTAGDSISETTTAGSVVARPVTVSADNDDPVSIERIRLTTSDTGAVGARVAVHVFSSDPTASSGVVGGDNAAWSNKRAGYLGRFEGDLRTFSDGAAGVLVPSEGNRMITKVGSGAATLWVQIQTLTGFTPQSASTWDVSLCGSQGQA